MSPDSALLFAAGFGTRMAPLTDTRPKPLIEVAGRALFDHALSVVRGAGIRRIAANTHHLASIMAAHLVRSGVAESHEDPIRDTGGGLKAALPLLSGDAVLTLNTDAVWTGPNPARAALDLWDGTRMEALMVLVPAHRALGHAGAGDLAMDAGGRLTFGGPFVYSGLQIIRTAPVAAYPDTVFGMRAIWDGMAERGRLFGIVHPGGWCDVGRPENIALAEGLLEVGNVRNRD